MVYRVLERDDEVRDDVDTVHTKGEAEPATTHDVTEGGLLGAVGGAVVGALAGGPLGAVIGAVVGGVASAGAVEVVDKHDHDHANTAHVSDREALASSLTEAPVYIEVTEFTELIEPPEVFLVVEETIDLTQAIRERAYELYELRGRADGLALQDWLAAEREFQDL